MDRELTVTVRAMDVVRVVALVWEVIEDRTPDEEAALSRLARTVETDAPSALEVLGLETLFKRSPGEDDKT